MSIKRSSQLSNNTFGIENSDNKENRINRNKGSGQENAGYHLIGISKRMRTRMILSFCLIFFNVISFYINSSNQGQTAYFITILVNIIIVVIMIVIEFAIIKQLRKAGEELTKQG